MKRVFPFIFTLLFFLSLSCDRAGKPDNQNIDEMKFDVNFSLLGLKFRSDESGVELSPPLGLNLMNDYESSELFKKMNSIDSNHTQAKPLCYFIDSSQKSMLLVNQFDSVTTKSLNEILANLSANLEKKFPKDKIKTTIFMKDSTNYAQILIMDDKLVNFKLIAKNKKNIVIHFDYLLSKDIYSNYIKSIESSIGSIKFF